MTRTLSLVVRNVVFTLVVPGLGAAWLPWRLLTRNGGTPAPTAWEAVPVIATGAALYVWCVWTFAAVGGGTPGYEERTLARRFGPAYLEYRRAVPRWIPRKPASPAGGVTAGAGKSRV